MLHSPLPFSFFTFYFEQIDLSIELTLFKFAGNLKNEHLTHIFAYRLFSRALLQHSVYTKDHKREIFFKKSKYKFMQNIQNFDPIITLTKISNCDAMIIKTDSIR